MTVPNILTFLRLILIPVFVVVAFSSPFSAALIIGVLATTDWIDGYIARRFHQESELGRILDPISDRLLTLTGFVTFFAVGAIPLWFVLVVGARELLVSVGTIGIYFQKHIRLDVNYSGKVSAFAAMTATPSWVFVHETHGNVHMAFLFLGVFSTTVAIVTGYYSLYEYLKAYRAA